MDKETMFGSFICLLVVIGFITIYVVSEGENKEELAIALYIEDRIHTKDFGTEKVNESTQLGQLYDIYMDNPEIQQLAFDEAFNFCTMCGKETKVENLKKIISYGVSRANSSKFGRDSLLKPTTTIGKTIDTYDLYGILKKDIKGNHVARSVLMIEIHNLCKMC